MGRKQGSGKACEQHEIRKRRPLHFPGPIASKLAVLIEITNERNLGGECNTIRQSGIFEPLGHCDRGSVRAIRPVDCTERKNGAFPAIPPGRSSSACRRWFHSHRRLGGSDLRPNLRRLEKESVGSVEPGTLVGCCCALLSSGRTVWIHLRRQRLGPNPCLE